MSVSVTKAVGSALSTTGRALFKPLDIAKWFVLGFCAWLAYLGHDGGGFYFRGTLPPVGPWHAHGGHWGHAPHFGGLHHSALAQPAIFVPLIAVAVVVGLVIVILLMWITSRARFMFLDGVVRNRGAVVEPWRRLRRLGNSLLGFRLVLMLANLVCLAGMAAVVLLIALPDVAAGRFGVRALMAILAGGLLLLGYALVMGVIVNVLEDFILPVMYARGVRTLEAWAIFQYELAPGHVGKLVLFYLMKLALGFVIAAAALTATCLTCCIALLPYIGTVILLPLYVFLRCYSLRFLEQFGPEWQLLPPDEPAGAAASAPVAP